MVTYEWLLETFIDSGDRDSDEPADVASFATLAELVEHREALAAVDARYAVALERTSDDGRAWAYVVNGALSEMMRDAFDVKVCRVPARFAREFAKSAR